MPKIRTKAPPGVGGTGGEVYGSSWERSSVPAPTIISIIISIIVSIIISIIASIIISIMIRIIIIIIVMNVKTLIINISTISLIRARSINDIQYNIIMIRYNGRAVVTTM